MTTDGEVIDRIERAELFTEKLRGVIEAVAACADAQGLRRITEPDLLLILNAGMGHLIERSKEAAEAAAEFTDQALDDVVPSRDAHAELRHDLDEVSWQVGPP
jgi:hypothetical protein